MILLQSSWVMELVTWCDVMYLHLKENYSYLHFALVQSKKRKNDYGKQKNFISNIKTNLSPYSTLSEWRAKP